MFSDNPTARGRWNAALAKELPVRGGLTWANAHLIGPFENAAHQGLFGELPPEHEDDLGATYPGKHADVRWTATPALDLTQPVDISSWMPCEPWSAVFLRAEVESDSDRIARLSIGSFAIVIATVNGLPILAPRIPYPTGPEDNIVMVALRPGTNVLLLKLLFMGDQWLLDCRGEVLGSADEVVAAFARIAASSPDAATRMVARYGLVETHAVLGNADDCRRALDEVRQDPFATEWDGQWADTVAGQYAATGTFLPIHDAQIEFTPVANPDPIATFWPQSSPPEEQLIVVDASAATPQEEFAVTVLQGLVNRREPRLYLLHTRYERQDRQWLDELHAEGCSSRTASMADVWKDFRGEISGAVLYDGSIMDEIGSFHSDRLNQTNVLMMIGALENAVPVTPEGNENLGLPVVFDARGKWGSQYEMMRWAYAELFPRTDHRLLATNYPGIFLLTDYLVQHKIFTFWFPEHRTLPESNLLDGILASTPPNTPIIGWWFDWMPNVKEEEQRHADAVMEMPGLLRGSYFGKVLTPSHEATNLSVHSGMPVGPYKHQSPVKPEYDPTKVYYSHILSDGDNLGEALMMRTRDLQWDKPERGSFPVGWSFAPAAARMAPPVLNYYLRTASENDLLVGGLGVGYTHPTIYLMAYPEEREELYAAYARLTDEALSWIDTTCLWLIDGGDEDEDRFARNSNGHLEGIFTGYGGGPELAMARRGPNNVIAFRSATRNTEETDKDNLIRDMVDQIRQGAGQSRPAFIEAWVLNWDWRMDMLQEVQRRLGSGFVCVRPDVLVRFRRQAGG
jgi:hypothetical protein